MNLRQIRYFCEIVEAGSAAHAASRLFVAPTAVSMQLGQLEEHLGGELFDRSRRPMELTPLGKYFYPRAKELLAQAKSLDEETRGIAAGKLGWLGIGFARSALFSILPQAVRRFRENWPDVRLDLVEALGEYQPELLREGRIHIGIARFIGEFQRAPDLRHEVMFEDPFVVALPASHHLAKRKSLRAVELDGCPYISYPKAPLSPFGRKMMEVLREAGANPVITYEAIELHTALSLVSAGLGLTLVGRSVAVNNSNELVFLPITGLKTKPVLMAITRVTEESRAAKAFLKLLVERKS